MQIVDLKIENERMVKQSASMLYEAFPHSWTDLEEAITEVRDCLIDGRIVRVVVDTDNDVMAGLVEEACMMEMYGNYTRWSSGQIYVGKASEGLWLLTLKSR